MIKKLIKTLTKPKAQRDREYAGPQVSGVPNDSSVIFEGYLNGNPHAQNFNPVKAPTSYSSHRGGVEVWGYDTSVYDAWEDIIEKNLNVASLIEQRGAMVLEREWSIKVEVETERSLAAKELVERSTIDLDDGFGWETRVSQMLFARFLGFTVHELLWHVVGNNIEIRAIRHRWNGQFKFDANANLYIEKPSGELTKAPENKFVVTRSGFPLLWDNPYGRGLLHKLIFFDQLKRNAEYWWGRYIETFGQPTIIGIYPGGSENTAMRKEIEAAIKQIGKQTGVVMPKGVEIEQLARTVAGGRVGSHRDLVEYIEGLETRLILGSTLTTNENEVGGSLAMAQVHENTTDKRVTPDAKLVMNSVNRYIIDPLIDSNFNNLPKEERPYFHIQTESEEEDTAKLDRYKGLVNDLKVPVAVSTIREDFGLPDPQEGEPLAGGISDPVLDADAEGADNANGDISYKGDAKKKRLKGSQKLIEFSEKFYTPLAAGNANRIFDVSELYSERFIGDARRRFDAYIKGIGEAVGDGGSHDILAALRIDPFELPAEEYADDLTDLFIGAQVIAFLDLKAEWEEQTGEDDFPLPSVYQFASPSEFEAHREALEWFVSRRIMNYSQAEEFLDYLITQGVDPTNAITELRDRALVLAGDLDASVTAAIRDTIVEAVEQGMTFPEFQQAIYDTVGNDPDKLPEGKTNQLETIYRTETANVYHKQREDLYNDPAVRAQLYGFDWYNPNDERSRPDHAALIGFIPIDHPAAGEVPPLDYNCRCAKYPVMRLPGREEPQPNDNIDEVWANLENRFENR